MTARTPTTGEAILEAAGRLLAAEGPSALTVRRIAAEAGGSTMNVYSRFGGKEGVVEALFRDGFARLHRAMAPSLEVADPVEALRRCGDAYRHFALGHPSHYAVMFEGVVPEWEPSPDATVEAAGTLELLATLVRRAMDAGVVRTGDPMAVAISLWATNHGLVSLELKGRCPQPTDFDAVHAATLDALVRGLRP